MTMNQITLTNDFHHTSVRLVVDVDNCGHELLSPSQVKRARRTLCGVAGCTCGDVAGCRPQQIEERQDGGGVRR